MSDEAKAQVAALDPEPPLAEASEASGAHDPPRRERDELLSPELWAALRKVVPVLWLAAAVVAGFLSGAALVCLVLAAGALVLVLSLMWSSVQSLTGGASLGFEEALGMGAPSRVEEEKRSVLRALKDLEYERGVGKLSAEDYAELSARYRAEAKRLMQTLDESLGPAREEAERAIAARLARAGLQPPPAESEAGQAQAQTPAEAPEQQPNPPESTEEAS